MPYLSCGKCVACRSGKTNCRTDIKVLEKGDFPVDSFIAHNVGSNEMIANFDSWIDQNSGVIKATFNF